MYGFMYERRSAYTIYPPPHFSIPYISLIALHIFLKYNFKQKMFLILTKTIQMYNLAIVMKYFLKENSG